MEKEGEEMPLIVQLSHQAQQAMEDLAGMVQANRLNEDLRASHLGFACGSKEEFEGIRTGLEDAATFLYQSKVNGRRVLLVQLVEPISTPLGPAAMLEVMDQKPDGSQTSGFDRLEAYPFGFDLTAADIANALRSYATVEKQADAKRPIYKIRRNGFTLRIAPGPLMRHVVATEIRP